MREKSAASPDRFPGHVQTCASVRRHFGEGRNGMFNLQKRWIKRGFIPADMVLVTKTASGNLDQTLSIDFAARPARACAKAHLDRRTLNRDHFLNQSASQIP